MNSFQAYFSFLEGNSYEIGRRQGEEVKKIPNAMKAILSSGSIDESKFKDMKKLIDQYCPGLNEELQGFSDSLNVRSSYLNFYDEAWLQPGGCSLGAILPSKTDNKETYVLRNYDLSPVISDMRLCTTKIKGRYSHTGFSVSYFGRSEGLNEQGFCVAFASCGIPVGKHIGMKKPVTKGLQFMVIVRALLENCKNVEEGIWYLEDMPIGTNMNLLLADAEGNAALIETYDGEKAMERVNKKSGFFIATNHAVMPEIIKIERGKLEQSEIRYNFLKNNLESNNLITKNQLHQLMLKEYPDGVTVHNFEENFGTVHSILFNLNDKQLYISFGSPINNKIYTLKVGEILPFNELEIFIENTNYGPDFWKLIK
ncbi:C45 family peptidase [Bacillus sp. AC79A.1]|uniref:C45 family autoproteolytic acyltransferase/hydolase n=1 Tax=Bacillus wiedmannii TaxID=1890302 RepID=UPI000BFE0493|nr:C45 family peptidase [Bacillus wiedmannii]PHF04949.1 choloylglycine hydrolase [Bacillus wiedmannii]